MQSPQQLLAPENVKVALEAYDDVMHLLMPIREPLVFPQQSCNNQRNGGLLTPKSLMQAFRLWEHCSGAALGAAKR